MTGLDSHFIANEALDGGGAIFNSGNVTCDSSTFSNNSARDYGGVMVNNANATVVCASTTFTSNSATDYGGVMINNARATVHCISTAFISNSASSAGAISNTAALTLNGVSFSGNAADDTGGAIINNPDSTFSCADSDFIGNTAAGNGGAVGGSGGIYCSATNFTSNSAAAGCAVFIDAAQHNFNFSGCTFLGNTAGAGAGGAILQQGEGAMASALLAASTFEGNSAGCCYTAGYEAAAQYTCLDASAGYSTNWQCCSAGQYIGAGDSSALLCKTCFSDSLNCSGIAIGATVATLPLTRGHWRETLRQEAIRDCWNPDACAGGMAVAAGNALNYCADGYQGPWPSAAALAFTGVALLVAVLLLGAWLFASGRLEAGMRSAASKAAQFCLQLLRRLHIPVVVLTQFVRVTGVLLLTRYLQFLRALDFINLDLSWLAAPGCVASFNFFDRLLVSPLTPPVVAALIFTPRMVAARVIARDVNLVLVFAFLIFSEVSLTVFQTFACDATLPVAYLRADYSVRCYTPAHRAHMAYAAAMMLRRRGETLDAAAAASFLWRPYRAHAPYFGCAECARRLLLTGVLVFIAPGTAGQSAAACVFAFATSVAYDNVRPHRARADACPYIIGYVVIFVSMFAALLMQGAYLNDFSQAAVGGVLVALNALLVLLAVGQVCVEMRSEEWDWESSLKALAAQKSESTQGSEPAETALDT
ncbi:hypothetical protein JKP88DRAFT_242326 [Tribonema minus]|uniref:Adhesin-like protein n=1 Tax=Tribonema minus TaxID=303371 RepID=A0A836C8H3_9STRA|nr:hypothetical protein JKP88DRAFT_242326 [Tribonema minus]